MPAVRGEVAGEFHVIEGKGALFIDGAPAVGDARIGVGNVLETGPSSVTVERIGKLTLRLERGSRARVVRAGGPLVLALERGAIEAQVVPVPSGQAFAVDIEGARVAVHGTHLRVARDGLKVEVDLSEGVVSIGDAAASAPLEGSLVVAPAHVGFLASNLASTLAVTHEPTALRSPVELGRTVATSPVATQANASPPHVQAPAAGQTTAASPAGARDAHVGAVTASPVAPSSSEEPSTNREEPEAEIAGAVRGCMAERPRAENVTVVVSTTLYLAVGDDGRVRSARFEPPVAPDINECAAQSIYKARFARGGAVSIPIDFKN
jgi:hypothetical protein